LVDNLRGANDNVERPFLDEPTTPIAALFGLFAGLAFLETGGAARVASALAEPRLVAGLGAAVERISDAMGVAVAIAAPLVAGSIVVEVALGLVSRAASPAYVFPLLLPLRSLSLLVVLWIALDRVVELLVVLAAGA
jgi:type III secretory pathway component EscT